MMTSAEALDVSGLDISSRSRLENTDVFLPLAVPAQPLVTNRVIARNKTRVEAIRLQPPMRISETLLKLLSTGLQRSFGTCAEDKVPATQVQFIDFNSITLE